MLKIITLFIGFSVVLNSCQAPSDKITEAFKTVDKSLEHTSQAVDSVNNMLYSANKLNCGIKQKADTVFAYIQKIKEELKAYSAEKFPSTTHSEPLLEDLATSNKLMIENKKSDTLFIQMDVLYQTALSCDTSEEIKKEISKVFDADFFRDRKEFNNAYFQNIPTVAALTMLSNFQNRIKNMLHILLTSVPQQKGVGAFSQHNP